MPSRQRAASQQPTRVLCLAFAAALVAGTAIRLQHLSGSPAWQWDETVYYRVATNLQHGVLSEHQVYGVPREPFLYQPPFYLYVLSRWFDLVGASIFHARILGVAFTAAMQALLFRLLWKLHGPRVALIATVPVIFDAWLLYIERVSYIENGLMVLIVATFVLYQRALERPSWQRFAIAGLAVGADVVVKQTGSYVVLAVALVWLINRQHRRGHLVLFGVAIAAFVIYVIVMISVFDVSGHAYFIDQSTVQIRRVLGLQHSGGTLTSPTRALHLLLRQYRYFVPSAFLALAGFALAVRRSWQCYKARSWQALRPNVLLYSWLVAGVIVFGVSSLKFPQYFALVLVPAYCFLWTEIAQWSWSGRHRLVVVCVAATMGTAAFLLTVPALKTNSLAEVQQYAATNIPRSAIVVTEQGVGDLITQRWCTVEEATPCDGVASYAITWRTYLQSSFREGDPAFDDLMRGAIAIRSFGGPVGTATVWKLRTIQ